MLRYALVFSVGLAGLCLAASSDPSNGWNSNLSWQTPAALQAMDLSHNTKPIMYLFNQPWCGACKRLKETFQQEGDKISKLSQKFILVNVGGDDNSGFGEAFAPDGGYIPRILFAEPSGTLRPDLKNPANQKEYAYFYDSMDKVRAGMKNALKLLGSQGKAETSEQPAAASATSQTKPEVSEL
ncbi:g13265 [Coccomyxa viridis]|uniref:G13265 protein n=1 Tax=Coccomyxa viridis TaxID=1274662 RepID=A0ABP1GF05_9CHLO